MKNIKSNQTMTLNYKDAVDIHYPVTELQETLFTDVANETNAIYKHTETFFNDYSFRVLLPQKYSQLGKEK